MNHQIMDIANKMIQGMSEKQRNKLNSLLQDEEKMKQAIAGIDPKKASQVMSNLKTSPKSQDDVAKLLEALQKNPDLIKNIEKKPL